jgi:hypothetical protein
MNQNVADQINLNEGTIEFRIDKGKLLWNDGLMQLLVNILKREGSILIFKDSSNKLKFMHILQGKGNQVEIDTSDLRSDMPHQIAATWSVSKKQICLYIDGGQRYNCVDIAD